MKIVIEYEVPDEYIELIAKQHNLTREQAAELIKKYLEAYMAQAWRIVLEGYHLLQAGAITFEKMLAESAIQGYKEALKIIKQITGEEKEEK
jgi:hypothetical protein